MGPQSSIDGSLARGAYHRSLAAGPPTKFIGSVGGGVEQSGSSTVS